MGAKELGDVFTAARTEFARIAPLVWNPLSEAMVEEAGPKQGDRVLDVCCGAGASAIAAGARVGVEGRVDAVDLAEGLLEEGREAAARQGVGNVRFVRADVTEWEAPDAGYDVVQSAFGVFFLPEMDEQCTRLFGMLRAGGRFAVAVWRKGAIEDFARSYYEVIGRFRPEQAGRTGPPGPIEQINTEAGLEDWLRDIGADEMRVTEVERRLRLDPGVAWDVVLGSGFRGALSGLRADEIEAVRAEFLGVLRQRGIESVDFGTLVGVGLRR
ncbi:ubiE/COQ5 methyltransferase family protein [Amycolatopsis marina]|uniref:UbiE/COQ5 methyltransferase family protein n=1 Tax=Amycolatopsis marina TaxID=490629 RepID=A0A1I0Y1I3_9PSEU|nr:class I SAM-dependent methyltransferase [Amycolatopsis marina]SFB06737.1 ubiE/COQ5 methyltransferase family protein [Amycolatopsis marina]